MNRVRSHVGSDRADLDIGTPAATCLRLPTTVVFGRGTVNQLGRIVRHHCGHRALVCSDAAIAKTAGFQRAMDSLGLAGIEPRVYARTPPDVPARSVLECFEENSSAPLDAVVAIGGGSCIDLAKLVALLRSYPGSLSEYYGENAVPGPCVPVVAVPTTSGTGSEVTPVAVLSDPGRRMKVGVSSAYLIPRATICDPELTLTCPPTVSAYAGIDALVHATEAYTAAVHPGAWDDYPGWVFRGKNIFSDIHALTAIRLIHGSLERVASDGQDIEARTAMMFGSLTAGMAFAHAGTAGIHALQYPIGSLTATAHGLGTGLLAPYVLDYVLPEAQDTLADIARAMGIADPGASAAEDARSTIDEITRLSGALGLPRSLADIGIEERDLDSIADDASTVTRLVRNSPRPLDRAALLEILHVAWRGERLLANTARRSERRRA